jgi:hypothetical protein
MRHHTFGKQPSVKTAGGCRVSFYPGDQLGRCLVQCAGKRTAALPEIPVSNSGCSSFVEQTFAERRVPAFFFAAISHVICIRRKFRDVGGSRQRGLKRII